MHTVSFVLNPLPPFRLDLTVWALRRRERNTIDFWDGEHYIRVLVLGDTPAKVVVRQEKEHLIVTVHTFHLIPELEGRVSLELKKILGLEIHLEEFYKIALSNKKLYEIISKFMGLKPPRFPTIFEALTNAIACQQVSLESGLSLLNRLSKTYGLPFQEGSHINYAFPEPKALMNCVAEELRNMGFTWHKSEALINLAKEFAIHKEVYSDLNHKSKEDIFFLLSNLKGIGRWSVEYTFLRGLGKLEMLPGDDVGLQKSLKNLLELDTSLDYDAIKKIGEGWYPYAGLLYFHLILHKLYEKGVIS